MEFYPSNKHLGRQSHKGTEIPEKWAELRALRFPHQASAVSNRWLTSDRITRPTLEFWGNTGISFPTRRRDSRTIYIFFLFYHCVALAPWQTNSLINSIGSPLKALINVSDLDTCCNLHCSSVKNDIIINKGSWEKLFPPHLYTYNNLHSSYLINFATSG